MRSKPALIAVVLGALATLAGCATNSGSSGDAGNRLVTPRGTYAYCPAPCYQPQWYGSQWYGAFGDLGDRRFYYPATPYIYSPFDPFWSDGWLVYQRPLPSRPSPPPGNPGTTVPPPATGPTVGPGTRPPPARPRTPNRSRME